MTETNAAPPIGTVVDNYFWLTDAVDVHDPARWGWEMPPDVQKGVSMMTPGVQPGPSGRQQVGTERALAYLYLFRRVVVGLALVGAGAAWVAQVPWLLAACLCIAIGELLESSYYIGVLRWGQRHGVPRPLTSAAWRAGSRA